MILTFEELKKYYRESGSKLYQRSREGYIQGVKEALRDSTISSIY
jgi:GTP:adenosylcobinamide-phosphate guanylyltransferase